MTDTRPILNPQVDDTEPAVEVDEDEELHPEDEAEDEDLED